MLPSRSLFPRWHGFCRHEPDQTQAKEWARDVGLDYSCRSNPCRGWVKLHWIYPHTHGLAVICIGVIKTICMRSQYMLIHIQTSQISEIPFEWVSEIENLQPANYQRSIVQWTQFSVCFLKKQDPPAKWLRRWRPASAIGIICVGSAEISHGKPSKS